MNQLSFTFKENDRAQKINFDHTIDKFATLKFRKQFFLRILKLNDSAGGGFLFYSVVSHT